jgi:type VI secretion system protein ImpH
MLSHFYRAWEKSRSEVAFERGGVDRLAPVVRAIVGLNAPGLEHRLAISDTALLFYSGLIGPSQRSAIGLEQLLADYFELPVRVEQFSGGWFELSPESFLRLGEDDAPAAQLGVGAVVGTAIWNEQARVRVRVGPLALGDFERFLPTGVAFGEMEELVRFYSDGAVDFDLQLVLQRDDVPPTVLGETASLPLGWGSWLCTRAASSDKDQVILPLQQELRS